MPETAASADFPASLLSLFGDHGLGVLVTLRRDGRPQLSNVLYVYDPQTRLIRVSVTADRAKTRNLARDSRASFHVTSQDGWSWTVVEGNAELSPVAREEQDASVAELAEMYQAVSGEHPDWDAFRSAMVAERRQVVRLHVEYAYGQ